MIYVLAIAAPDHLAGTVDQLLGELTERLEQVDAADEAVASASEPIPPNKLLVQGLIAKCKKAGREIEVRDIIAMADVDDSEFYKWQRGAHVGRRTRLKCEGVVNCSAREFLIGSERTVPG